MLSGCCVMQVVIVIQVAMYSLIDNYTSKVSKNILFCFSILWDQGFYHNLKDLFKSYYFKPCNHPILVLFQV